MEYLVNISKRLAFWSLNEDILKITILKTNTPYPSRRIRRIRACTHQRPQRNEAQYAVSRRSQHAISKILNCLELIVITNQTVPVSQAETPLFPIRIRIRTDIEYSEEEEAEAMAETMEQYMSKTRTNYGSGVVRPKIEEKDSADAKKAIQEMAEYSQKWHNGTPRGRRASVSVMPLLTYLNLGLGEFAHTKLTVELADRTMKYPKGISENILVRIGKFTFPVDFIILDMLEDIKVPLILGRPFLSTVRAKIDVYKRKITLRVREEKIIYKSVKSSSSLIKRVYMLILRERMELDLEARLMGETLVLNRSFLRRLHRTK
ncbi:gag-pol polyprotein [Tanacetum coccineum]